MSPAEFRSIRHEAGLSQSGLATLLGVTKISVQNWENSRRPISGPVALLMGLMEQGRFP